jgi:hypothetical protein
VKSALQWLSERMMNTPTDGNCGGRAYTHGIATLALAEGYAMTKIPPLRESMDKGLARIVMGQQAGGGFDYNYGNAGGEGRWDMSVGGWQFQALKAGHAAGSLVPGVDDAIAKAIDHLKNDAYANKRFGYTSAGSGGNMTGVGTVALQLFGQVESAQARGGVETIVSERLTLYRNVLVGKSAWPVHAGFSIYGWYYDTQAMFIAQGKDWREWQNIFEKVLISNQHPKGYWAAEGHGFNDKDDGGRILSTCWCALQLEVYYRYPPNPTFTKREIPEPAPTLDVTPSTPRYPDTNWLDE